MWNNKNNQFNLSLYSQHRYNFKPNRLSKKGCEEHIFYSKLYNNHFNMSKVFNMSLVLCFTHWFTRFIGSITKRSSNSITGDES